MRWPKVLGRSRQEGWESNGQVEVGDTAESVEERHAWGLSRRKMMRKKAEILSSMLVKMMGVVKVGLEGAWVGGVVPCTRSCAFS